MWSRQDSFQHHLNIHISPFLGGNWDFSKMVNLNPEIRRKQGWVRDEDGGN